MRLQAQYRRILSCRCTADSPQIDYGRYLANRGGHQHPTGGLHHGATQSARFTRSQANHDRSTRPAVHVHSTTEESDLTPLRELRAPSSVAGRVIEKSHVTVERIKEETEPFLK